MTRQIGGLGDETDAVGDLTADIRHAITATLGYEVTAETKAVGGMLILGVRDIELGHEMTVTIAISE